MDRLKNLKIKLPILLDGSPDWEWIESYVKNTLIPQLPHTAQELFYNDFFPKAISPKKLTLDTKSWKWFQIDILFDIVTSKDDNLVDAQE